ncbi:RNA polymerase sigma factor [Anaerohalosphaera lusitana]|uniref:RNA polymerase sigma factor n=1 Tax=Anaerohalosphaera lusitana TaxID=1936003 RepID=A0A1U9NJR9_9BACT|nr:sigma-70 family RNA polymerase sigma factor [Anaerohalosphaera lusitana]AQT68057.1 RNA polymerase sigma factor [Anaerohalosphaera lusitana]
MTSENKKLNWINGDEVPESSSGEKDATSCYFRLLTQNYRKIYSYILTLVPSRSDADDIMQETATVMWTKFSEFKEGTNFAGWGIRIAYFQVLYFYRKNKARPVQFPADILEKMGAAAEKKSGQNEELLKTLRECVERLDERDRKLLQMRYEQGMAPKNLAEFLSKPVKGIYRSMSRIHNTLVMCIRRTLAAEESL